MAHGLSIVCTWGTPTVSSGSSGNVDGFDLQVIQPERRIGRQIELEIEIAGVRRNSCRDRELLPRSIGSDHRGLRVDANFATVCTSIMKVPNAMPLLRATPTTTASTHSAAA